jgi:hypothetical protein
MQSSWALPFTADVYSGSPAELRLLEAAIFLFSRGSSLSAERSRFRGGSGERLRVRRLPDSPLRRSAPRFLSL